MRNCRLERIGVEEASSTDKVILVKQPHKHERKSLVEIGNGNPFQYSCLENSMDRGAWRATVQGVTKSQTRLSSEHFMDSEFALSSRDVHREPCSLPPPI